MAKVKSLRLADITIDPDIQPRAKGTDKAVVAEYAAAIELGAEFPPLVVYESGNRLILSEGFTRAAAYAQAKREKVDCEVRPGDRRAAILNACGSNVTHGQRRTNADKRRAVELVLKEYPSWSNRKVADAAAVDDKTVASIRNPPAEHSNNCTAEIPQDGCQNDATPEGVQVSSDDTSPPENAEETPDSESDAPSDAEQEAAIAALESDAKPDPGAAFVAAVETLCRDIDQLAKRMKELKASPLSYSMHVDSAVSQVEAARKTLWQGRPAHECPYCHGEGCKACNSTGRVKKTTYDSGMEAVGGAK